ncbi:MAG: LPS export ABC transporter periplasmic protein LptC, partial [Deltaproteobacteria bacterium]|nr:LPS export ABC transporter periplasmic protein LptC [Deltaproteobacteria bacterium]
LDYSPSKRAVHTDEEIYVRGPEINISGKGMEYNIDTSRLTIFNHVKVLLDNTGSVLKKAVL